MLQDDSFHDWIGRLRAGDDEAASRVFHRYAKRLVGLASRKLALGLRRKVDPEDIVQSVFRSFFVRHADGQYELQDWDSLWAILAVITVRKSINRGKFHRRGRRDAYREVASPHADDSRPGWEFVARDPTPEEALILAETVDGLMQQYDERDREILALALQGFSVREISEQVGYAERTVRRVLQRVREDLEGVRDGSSDAG